VALQGFLAHYCWVARPRGGLMLNDVAFTLALHVLAVIHWIGGLAFVTLVVLPLARLRSTGEKGVMLFESVERRFAAQVRFSIPLAGATGLWMTYRMDLWGRFADPHFWWMSAMLGLWLIFMLLVFVLEPLLHERLKQQARLDPASTLRRIMRLHTFLLTLAALTVLGAAAGAHGFGFF
jgi:uncharacterized membrane protein